MDAVRTHLVRRGARVVLLLDPPFDRSAQEPGYIKGYPPGVRENGGQYTHAAAWMVMALAQLGSGDEAAELFHMLNPINHTRDAARTSSATRASPTSSRATSAPTPTTPGARAGPGTPARRAGCTAPGWRASSGSAATGRALELDPCIPAVLACVRGELARSGGRATRSPLTNPERRCRGIASATLDGGQVDPRAVPLVDDGGVHEVRLVLGAPGQVATAAP